MSGVRRTKDNEQAFGNQILDLSPPNRGGGFHLAIQFIIDLDRRFHRNKLTGKPAFCQNTEYRSQKIEFRIQNSEFGRQKTEDRRTPNGERRTRWRAPVSVGAAKKNRSLQVQE